MDPERGKWDQTGMAPLKCTICHDSTITAQNTSAAVEEITADPGTVRVKGFMHKASVCKDAVPVQQKRWHLPFAVRQAVSDELSTLLTEGVIERIDASPWVSPIVVATKGGQIRLCVDLREPNKALIVDKNPVQVNLEAQLFS